MIHYYILRIRILTTWMRQFTLTLLLSATAAATLLPQLPITTLALLAATAAATAATTHALIPRVREYMLRKNIFGLDINKLGTEAG